MLCCKRDFPDKLETALSSVSEVKQQNVYSTTVLSYESSPNGSECSDRESSKLCVDNRGESVPDKKHPSRQHNQLTLTEGHTWYRCKIHESHDVHNLVCTPTTACLPSAAKCAHIVKPVCTCSLTSSTRLLVPTRAFSLGTIEKLLI